MSIVMQGLTLAIYSLTLSIILNLIYIVQYNFTGFEIPYFEMLYLLIAYIYIIAAILIIKTDLINQVMQLQRIQEEQKKISQENNEENEPNIDKKKDKKEKKEEQTEEEKDFYELIGDFLLQKKQKQVIERNLF